MLRRTIAAALLVCVVLALSACGSKPQTTGNEGGAGPATTSSAVSGTAELDGGSPETESSGPAKVGDQLTAGPWGVSVSEVYSKGEAPGMVKPAAGKEFMYVQVSLSNNGSSVLVVKPEDFSMTDSSGAPVKPFGKRQAYNAVDMSPLEPKYGTSTAFIFEVAPGSTGYTFTFAPEVDGARIPRSVTVP
jgi:hypothetical protein